MASLGNDLTARQRRRCLARRRVIWLLANRRQDAGDWKPKTVHPFSSVARNRAYPNRTVRSHYREDIRFYGSRDKASRACDSP